MPDQPATPCCPTCGARLATDTGEEWCPSCAFAAVLTVPDNAEEDTGGILFKAPGHAVLAELGRGATGIVYRARQASPARDVALKLLRPHEAGSVESRARFRLEAVALAELDHPVILPVFSVGEHDGLPYFTMKLCVGGTLAHRLDRYRGQWRAVAVLLATLADGVHYAHSRGVLHRDLKPGNVLFDEADRPFVSDFGLAKLINTPDSGGSVTRPLVVMGTPGYVAPEVLAGGANAATTAADVYALGAILYELLTGAPPAAAGAANAFPSNVPRDLAVICRHSLRVEPAARYPSADALAADLRAWLAGRPIAARPRSGLGHAWAWARRNPVLAGVSLVAVLLLIIVALVATSAAVRLRQEQRATAAALEKARTEAAISRAVTDFLQNDLLAQASPDQQPDRNLTLRAVVDRAASRIDGRFTDQPLVEAALRGMLAETYRSLGEYGLTERNLEREIELRRAQAGAEAPPTLAAMDRLAHALLLQGKVAEAEALTRRTLEQQRRVLGPEHSDTLRSMETLGDILIWAGKTPEAESVYAQTVAGETRVFGPDDPRTLIALVGLAEVYSSEQHYNKSEAILLQALDRRRRLKGPDHPDTLDTMNHLGMLYGREGNFAAAGAIIEQGIAIRTRTLGAEHPDTLIDQHNLACNYLFEGRFAEAEALERNILPVNRRVLGPDHPVIIYSTKVLARALAFQGRFAEAETLLREALAASRRNFGPENHETVGVMSTLGFVYQQEGKTSEAESLLRQALEIGQRMQSPDPSLTLRPDEVLGLVLLKTARPAEAEGLFRSSLGRRMRLNPDGWSTAFCQSFLGEALVGERRWAEAEPLLLAGFAGLESRAGTIPASAGVSIRHVAECLVRLYMDWGKPAEAEAWRQKLGGSP